MSVHLLLSHLECFMKIKTFSPVPMNQGVYEKPKKCAFLASYPGDFYAYKAWDPLY